jgi:hypothetical protein
MNRRFRLLRGVSLSISDFDVIFEKIEKDFVTNFCCFMRQYIRLTFAEAEKREESNFPRKVIGLWFHIWFIIIMTKKAIHSLPIFEVKSTFFLCFYAVRQTID